MLRGRTVGCGVARAGLEPRLPARATLGRRAKLHEPWFPHLCNGGSGIPVRKAARCAPGTWERIATLMVAGVTECCLVCDSGHDSRYPCCVGRVLGSGGMWQGRSELIMTEGQWGQHLEPAQGRGGANLGGSPASMMGAAHGRPPHALRAHHVHSSPPCAWRTPSANMRRGRRAGVSGQ